MAPKSVTFRRHDHLVSVLFGDLLSHSYNITFSMFLDLVHNRFAEDGIYSNTYLVYVSSDASTGCWPRTQNQVNILCAWKLCIRWVNPTKLIAWTNKIGFIPYL